MLRLLIDFLMFSLVYSERKRNGRVKMLRLLIDFLMFSLVYSERKLALVHTVYRHGARAPIEFYPNYRSDWPVDPGMLTAVGMNMEYDLGKFLKKRYIEDTHFLNQSYLHKEVYIRSSDEPRCLQSAETQLAGLYPPKGYQEWNKDIPWQPIPVHTVPGDQDPILRAGDLANCTRLKQLKDELNNDPEYKRIEEENKDYLKFLSNKTGWNVTFDNLWKIGDVIIAGKTQGIAPPDWYTDNPGKLDSLASWLFLRQYIGVKAELAKILGGALLDIINSNMNAYKDEEKRKELYKIILFSGHDTSILSLVSALDVKEITVPTFAACLMIELYQENDELFVELNYRNDSSGDTYALQLKECGPSCPLETFISLTKSRASATPDCKAKQAPLSDPVRKNVVWIIVGCTLGIILISLIILGLRRRKSYHSNIYIDDVKHELIDRQTPRGTLQY